jgi:hypothetical protein
MVILEMDHKNKIIKVLTLVPSINVVNILKQYKSKSKKLSEEHTVYYDDIVDGEKKMVSDKRNFLDYNFLPITAPYDYIEEIIYNSQNVDE